MTDRLPQAEQDVSLLRRERDEALESLSVEETERADFESSQKVLLARLREYEEALRQIARLGKHSRTVPSLQRIARDALGDASNG